MAGAAAPLAAPVPEVAAPFPPLAAPVPEVAAPSPPLAAPVPEVAAPSPLYASLLPRLRRRRVPGSAVTSLFAEVPLRSRGPMELLFGRRRSPEELLRQNQRALARAVRELERERQKLEAQEKKIIVDIKKMAKQGQMDAVRVLAKDLVRTRRYERKFMAMRANVQGVALRVQTLRSHSAMATAMRGVTRAMATMNRQEFQKQSELMDMKEELMNDAIDDALGDEDDEDESDAVVSQVLDELGLNLTEELATLPAPGGSLAAGEGRGGAEGAAAALADADADLEERLKNLRRD
ncbi:charged multivesicular body protein 2a isoform X2 [Melospiza melodia melodia]|uniref:charged multivesicular body protein 2a isoform X2 n=1 Tax=Melospiza melodia melodia TaxID=1914991 RepID=UPI002FD432E9